MSDPIDFSSLDPTRAPEAWETRVRETVEQAALLRSQDLSAIAPFAEDQEDRVRETVEQAALLRSQDLSAIAPFVGDQEAHVRQTVERVNLARSPEAADGGETGRAKTAPPVVAPLIRLAPRALAMAACLAAAAWLLVWVAPPEEPSAGADPALAMMSWAASDSPLTAEQMSIVTGGSR